MKNVLFSKKFSTFTLILLFVFLFLPHNVFAQFGDVQMREGQNPQPTPAGFGDLKKVESEAPKSQADCDAIKSRTYSSCMNSPSKDVGRCTTESASEYYRCTREVELLSPTNSNAQDNESGYQIPRAEAAALNQFQGQSLQQVIGNFMKTAMGIMGSIAFAIMVFGGFLWMTSGGSSDKSKKALDMIVWAAMGVLVIFSSYAIVQFIFNAFTN